MLGGPIGAQNRPMSTFPDAAQPNLTSRGVVNSSQWARLVRFMYQVIFWSALSAGILLIWSWASTFGVSLFDAVVCF